MRVPFRLVDVFAEAPFGGNQLCVVPETPDGLDGATMQALALEIGFSETTFVTAVRPDGYDVRIFTPEDELPFAGHPHPWDRVRACSRGRDRGQAIQRCGAGDVPVRIDLAGSRATMRQLPPEAGPRVEDRRGGRRGGGPDRERPGRGLPIVPVSTGIPHAMVAIRDDDALRRAVRDDRRCAEVCARADAESLYLFVVRGPKDVRARMFDKGSNIGEDPATGSAAGPLGAYLVQHQLLETPGSVVIAQGEQVGRPSFLHVDVDRDGDAWRIDVGGGVRPMGEGVFEL